jgi:hypothetical protein
MADVSNPDKMGDLTVRCSPRLLGIFVVLVVVVAALILTAESYTEKEEQISVSLQRPPHVDDAQGMSAGPPRHAVSGRLAPGPEGAQGTGRLGRLLERLKRSASHRP